MVTNKKTRRKGRVWLLSVAVTFIYSTLNDSSQQAQPGELLKK